MVLSKLLEDQHHHQITSMQKIKKSTLGSSPDTCLALRVLSGLSTIPGFPLLKANADVIRQEHAINDICMRFDRGTVPSIRAFVPPLY